MRAHITIEVQFNGSAEQIDKFVAAAKRDLACDAIGTTEFTADITTRTTDTQTGWIDQQSF